MPRRHLTRTLAVIGAGASLLTGSLAAAAAPADPPGQRSAAQAAAHWTPEKIASAAPRDLVVDERGLGYLRGRTGRLAPYGHSIAATQQPLRALPTRGTPTPQRPPSSGDSTPPVVSAMDPAGATIGDEYTFSAVVTDASGVRSVSFTVGPEGGTSQTFNAAQNGDIWSLTIRGFTDGGWQWQVEARDNARRGGNSATTDPVAFEVNTGSGGGGADDGGTGDTGDAGGDVVVNAEWPTEMTPVGRVYFEMPSSGNPKRPWTAYVCSGTVVTDEYTNHSLVLTAAHCIYDDVYKVFARNVLFIPDQDATTGAGTDTNCTNDPLGCWSPAYGVVDDDWTTRTFPDNIPWDYGYYVVEDASLESVAGTVPTSSVDATHGAATDAIGYSYADDPNLMYCSEGLGSEGTYGSLWLDSCGLSGGASGGPWLQPGDQLGSGSIMSVNSWGYTSQPGMGGPNLHTSSALCLVDNAIADPSEARGLVQPCDQPS